MQFFRARGMITALLCSLFAAGCGRPTVDDLCTHYGELTQAEAGGELKPTFRRSCEAMIEGRRLDAGQLRWGRVSRCVMASDSREAMSRCWVGEKPDE